MRPATTALIVVDAQRGFTDLCPDELPVPGGLAIVPAVNRLLAAPWARVEATQDWHPPDHASFLARGGPYPPHCVAGTPGAEFLPGLDTDRFHAVWRKGYDRDRDAYAVTAQHPGFAAALRAAGVTDAVVCGLAINICCFHTAVDLLAAGFGVVMAEDAAAGIDVPAAGLFRDRARADAAGRGVRYLTVDAVLAGAAAG